MADPVKPELINLFSLVKGFGLPEPGEKENMVQSFPESYPGLPYQQGPNKLNVPVPPMSIAPPGWLDTLVRATMPTTPATSMPMTPQNQAPAQPLPASDAEVAAGTAAVTAPPAGQMWSEGETQAALAGTPPDTGGNEPVETGTPAPQAPGAQPPAGPVRTDEYTVTPSGQMTEGPPQPGAAPKSQLTPEEVLGPELWANLQERATRDPSWLNWIGVGLQGSVDPQAAQRSMETWRVDKNQAQQELTAAAERTSRFNVETNRQEMREREAETKAQGQIDKEMARQRSINFRTALTSMKSPKARGVMMGVQNLASKPFLTDQEEATLEQAQTEAMAVEQDYIDDQQIGAEVLRLAPAVGKGEAPAALLDFTINKIKDPAEKAAYAEIARKLGEEGAKIREATSAAKMASVEAARIKAEASKYVAKINMYTQTLRSRTQIESERADVLSKQAVVEGKIAESRNLLTNPNLDDNARRELEGTIASLESIAIQYDSNLMVLDAMRDEAKDMPAAVSEGTPSRLVSPNVKPAKMKLNVAWQQVWDRSLVTAAQAGIFSNPAAIGSMDARAIEKYITSTASSAELEQVADLILDNMEYLTGMERDRLVTELNSRLSKIYNDRINSDWTPNFFQSEPSWISPAGPAATNSVVDQQGNRSDMIFSQESR